MKTAYVQSAVIESKDNQISAKVSGRVMPFRKLFCCHSQHFSDISFQFKLFLLIYPCS